MALMSTLVDTFATNDLSTLWSNSYGTNTWTAGQVATKCDSSYDSALISSGSAFTLTASYFFAKVTPDTSSGASTYIQLTTNGSNFVQFQYTGGDIQAAITQGGTYSYIGGTTYNATSHAWWRIREASGTLYFDTAPDGVTWTNQFSTTYTMAVTAMGAGFYAGGASTAGVSDIASVNSTTALTATATLVVTPTLTADATRTPAARTDTGVLAVTPTLTAETLEPGVLTDQGTLGITPTLTADVSEGLTAAGNLTVTPTLTAAPSVIAPAHGLVYMGGFQNYGGNAAAAQWAEAQGLPNADGGFQSVYQYANSWASIQSLQVSIAEGMAGYPGPCCLNVAFTQSDTETNLSSSLSGSSLTTGCQTAHAATATACLANGVQFIRTAWEFNGGDDYNWMPPWGSYTAAEFITLWRLIYDVYSSAAVSAGKPANWFKFIYCMVQNDGNGAADLVNFFPGMPYAAYLTIDEYDRTGGGYTGWAEALNDPPTVTQMVSYAIEQGCEGVGFPEWGIRNDAYGPSVIPDPSYIVSAFEWAHGVTEQGLNVLLWPWGEGYNGGNPGTITNGESSWNFAAFGTGAGTMWGELTSWVATGISEGWVATTNPINASTAQDDTASLAVTPTLTADGSASTHPALSDTASLAVTPTLTADASRGGVPHTDTASLAVTPTLTSLADLPPVYTDTGSLAITPTLTADASRGGVSRTDTASLAVAPAFTAEPLLWSPTTGAPAFAETFPGKISGLQLPVGAAPGPGGGAVPAIPGLGSGWEVKVRSYADYNTLLCSIPDPMLLGQNFTKQLDDLGSGTVTLSQDDAWWDTVPLGDGNAAEEILDYECLWQICQNGVVRFEFLGETITEQLVDQSEQRIVTITGPGTIATLKWAMCAPQGFPNIVLKLDGIEDSFDEIGENGQGVIDTNIWNSVSPSADVYITPVEGLYTYPGGAGYSLSDLYPSGSVTVQATPATTFFGATPYDATDTLISAQVTPIGLNTTTGDYSTSGLDGSEVTQFYVQSNANQGYYALMGLTATAFYCKSAGPNGTFTKSLPVYDPTNHAYWQITEQAGSSGGSGTFYFWTSPDGENWTLQWQVVHTWNATDCAFYFTAAYDVTASQSAQMTNLNSNVSAPSFQGALYLGYPIMGIWYDQWAKAQARGTIPFTTTSMSPGGDSFGNPWTDTQNVQTVNGTDLYSFLQSCTSILNADYVMQPGFVLQVGQPTETGISLGVQRQGQIIFREGRDCMSRQRTRQRNQIQNVIGAQNQDGHEISATDGTSVTSWGQREAWFQTGAQVDPTSMAIAAAAAAAANSDEITSNTLTITPNLPGKTVFQNFDVGDWVGLEDPNFTVNADRVMAIAVQVGGDGSETHELTLQTYVQWLEQQLTFISNQLGGSFVNAPGLTPVAPSKYGTGQVPTYFTPAQSLSTLTDVIGNAVSGSAPAQAPLVYNPSTGSYQPAGSADPVTGTSVPMVVAGADGAVTLTGGGLEVSTAGPAVAPDGGGAQPAPSSVATSPFSVVTVVNGVTRITTGIQPDGTVTTVESNAPPPGIPDTPTVYSVAGGLAVVWDGLLDSAPPLYDFLQVQVHVSTASDFTPSAATLQGTLETTGIYNVPNLTPGATYYTVLLALNQSQAASAPSAQVTQTAGYVTSGDILSVTASLLGNLGVLNANPYFWGGDGTGWAGVGGTFSVTSSPPAGAPYKYAGLFTSNGSADGGMQESGVPFPVTPGSQCQVTGWVCATSTSLTVGCGWGESGTPVSVTTQTVTVPANTWVQIATVVTAPASGVNQGYAFIGPASPVNGGTVYGQAILVLPQIPGALIQAGTIEAAQIAAGAVFAGVVNGTLISGATLEGGVVTGGLISGATMEGGLISGGVITGTIFEGVDYRISSLGVFFYGGTPAEGNLVLSIAGAGGANDGLGNSYQAGVTVYGTNNGALNFSLFTNNPIIQLTPNNAISTGFIPPQIQTTYVNSGETGYFELAVQAGNTSVGADAIPAKIILFTSSPDGTTSVAHVGIYGGPSSTGELIADFNQNGLDIYAGWLTLPSISEPPINGQAQLYGNLNGTPYAQTGNGFSGATPLTLTDNTVDTNPNESTQPCTEQWEIWANDAQVSTWYEIETHFSGTTASGTLTSLGFKPSLNGSSVATSNGDTIGASDMASNAGFTGKIKLTLQVTATGTSGSVNIFMDGGYAQEENVQAGSGSNSGYLHSQVTGVAFNTTVANTIAIDTVWSGNSAGQTVSTHGSLYTRRGP